MNKKALFFIFLFSPFLLTSCLQPKVIKEKKEVLKLESSENNSSELKKEEITKGQVALDRNSLARKALLKIPAGFVPVMNYSNAVCLFYDADENGKEDIFLLVCRKESGPAIQIQEINKPQRLFNPQSKELTFSLLPFLQDDNQAVAQEMILLGKELVFERMAVFPLKTGQKGAPYIIAARFQTREGIKEIWKTFYQKVKCSEIILRNNNILCWEARDLDDDNALDILIYQKSAEEGLGIETFITWYKWTGQEYQRYKTSNILRNLMTFIKDTEYFLKNKAPNLAKYGLLEADYLAQKNKGKTEWQILDQIFHFGGNTHIPISKLIKIKNIRHMVYPAILESPFSLDTNRMLILPVSIICQDNSRYYYTLQIYLNTRIFTEKQFCFRF